MRRRWGFTFLYVVGAWLALDLAAPCMAASYSTWVDRPSGPTESLIELARGHDSCCKHCTKGQPCGNSCISVKDKCHKPPGCAC
jgi:hypothetical protein